MQKIILITGCSSGLGKLLAELLAKKGYVVYAGIRNDDDRKKISAMWKVYPNLFPIRLDITNEKECQNVVAAILKTQKKIDVLVNNAGLTLVGPVLDFSAEDFSRLLDTNVLGAFRLMHEVLPGMKARKSGQIITITSLNGLVALPNFSLYSASKFALEGLTRALIPELARDNIFITNIEPGAMKGEVDATKQKQLPHKPARERFWLLRVLLPIISISEVAQNISSIIESKSPPTSVLLGADAKFTTFLQRFLPNSLWNKLLNIIWYG